ncbi:MAG: DUF1838 family protein [Gammaproteobacteria bacterium]
MSDYQLDNPQDLLEAQVKLRGSLDGSMSIWWLKATQYAAVDCVLTPLYNLLNASFQKFKAIDETKYEITMLELAYFADLESGEALSSFINPFTGKTGTPPPAIFGPNRVSLTTDGLQPPENFPFGTLTFSGGLGPGYTDGKDVWVREDTLVEMESDNPAFGNYIYNELVTYRGDWAALNDRETASIPGYITYSTTSNWRPWMMADDTPGNIVSEGYGKKVTRIDELPLDYLKLASQHDPQVLADPVKLLDTPPSIPAGD